MEQLLAELGRVGYEKSTVDDFETVRLDNPEEFLA